MTFTPGWVSGARSFGVPVLAVEDAREAVAAVLDGVVGAEQAALDLRRLGAVAAADEDVAEGQLAEHLLEEVR